MKVCVYRSQIIGVTYHGTERKAKNDSGGIQTHGILLRVRFSAILAAAIILSFQTINLYAYHSAICCL